MKIRGTIGPLKAFFIIPSLISIIVLATFGYSVLKISEDMQMLLTTSAPKVSFNGTHLIMEGFTLKNRGLYPLSLKIMFNITIGSSKENTSQSINILPNSEERMKDIILHVNETALQSALMNETTVALNTHLDIYIKPLIEITIQNTTITKIGPLINVRYNVNRISDYNSTHMEVIISYDITSKLPQSINGQVQISVFKDAKVYGYGETTLNISANAVTHGSIPVLIQKTITPGTYNAVIKLTINGLTKTSTLAIQIP